VNATGYFINTILVLLVGRQIRGSRLDLVNLVLPVVLVNRSRRLLPACGTDGRQ
jgi:hypothetical protein